MRSTAFDPGLRSKDCDVSAGKRDGYKQEKMLNSDNV